jgi:mannose-6-phosphate isomerase-like protein (cupin superfamily)
MSKIHFNSKDGGCGCVVEEEGAARHGLANDIAKATFAPGSRYPKPGSLNVNEDCEMVVVVIDGFLNLTIAAGETLHLHPGDAARIPRGALYFWENPHETAAQVAMFSTPAWHPGQYRNVPQ